MPKQGLHLITPTSIASSGTGNSSSINTNGSVTFTSCVTLSLNGVFSAGYDNYMIVVRNSESVADVNNQFRLRASGTDNSTASSYVYQLLLGSGTLEVASRTTTNIGQYAYGSSTRRNGSIVHFYGPYLAQPTAWRSTPVSGKDDASIYDYAGTHNQSTAYDGFTLLPDNGASTGLICVYGMRK